MMQNTRLSRSGCCAAAIALTTGLLPCASALTIDRPSFEVPGMVIVWAVDDADPNAGVKVVDFMAEAPDGTLTDLIPEDGRTLLTGTLDPTNDFAAGPDTPIGRIRLRDLDDDTTTIVDPSQGTVFTAFDPENMELNHYREDVNNSTAIYSSQFGIASNTGFAIRATVGEEIATGDFNMNSIKALVAVHSSANINGTMIGQHSTTSTGHLNPRVTWIRLSYLGEVTPFQIQRATATAPGTILDQSILFNPRYLLTNSDASMPFHTGEAHARSLDLSLGSGEVSATVTYTIYAL